MIQKLISRLHLQDRYSWMKERKTEEYLLSDMLQELMNMGDELTWALRYTFAQDPVHRAIPQEQAKELCQRALDCGHEQAGKLKARFTGQSIQELCSVYQVQVLQELKDGAGGQIRFAEYVEPDQIWINEECVKRAEKLLQETDGMGELREHDVLEVLLAHECYHYIEYRNPEIFTVAYRQKRGRTALFGPGRLISLREIGAGAFASEMLGYSYPSSLYDVLFTYCFSPKAAFRLYERIKGSF